MINDPSIIPTLAVYFDFPKVFLDALEQDKIDFLWMKYEIRSTLSMDEFEFISEGMQYVLYTADLNNFGCYFTKKNIFVFWGLDWHMIESMSISRWPTRWELYSHMIKFLPDLKLGQTVYLNQNNSAEWLIFGTIGEIPIWGYNSTR